MCLWRAALPSLRYACPQYMFRIIIIIYFYILYPYFLFIVLYLVVIGICACGHLHMPVVMIAAVRQNFVYASQHLCQQVA